MYALAATESSAYCERCAATVQHAETDMTTDCSTSHCLHPPRLRAQLVVHALQAVDLHTLCYWFSYVCAFATVHRRKGGLMS
jgi:hypothetical protein